MRKTQVRLRTSCASNVSCADTERFLAPKTFARASDFDSRYWVESVVGQRNLGFKPVISACVAVRLVHKSQDTSAF